MAVVSRFEFEVVTVDANGIERERHTGQAWQFIEDLGGGVELEMVEIVHGAFTMGSPTRETDYNGDEGPRNQVRVGPFLMGKYEVTQAQWRVVAGLPKVNRDLNADPSSFKGDDLPVEQVSWEDAMEFCDRLSRHKGSTYRLPTEAEWEYAARAGMTTPFAFGPTITPEIANYDGNYPYGSAPKGVYREKTVPVGSLGVANEFGLYDMHGNVWEWCLDWYSSNYYEECCRQGAITDPRGPAVGSDRVIRGGCWNFFAVQCRSADRYSSMPSAHGSNLGFRLVRNVR